MSATTTRAGARLAEKLRRAVQMNEFIVHYQPIVDLKNGGVVGVEALVRWRRSDGTLVPPAEFIPIAEDLGLIVPIARIALFEAMRQTLVWQRSSPKMRCLHLHVNLSARHLRQPDMVADIADALETTDYDPGKTHGGIDGDRADARRAAALGARDDGVSALGAQWHIGCRRRDRRTRRLNSAPLASSSRIVR